MANSRARSVDDTEGMVKMIADSKTDKILGVHIMGPNAGQGAAAGGCSPQWSGAPSVLVGVQPCHLMSQPLHRP